MSPERYPPLSFSLGPAEIAGLVKEGWLDKDYSIDTDKLTDQSPAIVKLLYAQIWKNGGVQKLQHIARGVAEGAEATVPVKASVFHQFGVHLADRAVNPIVDQHVIRAFALYHALEAGDAEVRRARSIGQLTTNWHRELIVKYKGWLAAPNNLTDDLRTCDDCLFAVDRVLFVTGRAVK